MHQELSVPLSDNGNTHNWFLRGVSRKPCASYLRVVAISTVRVNELYSSMVMATRCMNRAGGTASS